MGLLGAILGPVAGAIAGGLFGGGGDDGDGGGPPPGNKDLALLAELFSSTGALDALFQNISAREDPTIPALLNAQLSQLSDIQGGGGFDANAFLSGDFSTPDPSNPLTLGGADSPFNVPFQVAGGIDPIIQALIDQILTPATVTQGVKLGTPLTDPGSGGRGIFKDFLPGSFLPGKAGLFNASLGLGGGSASSGSDLQSTIDAILGGTEQGPEAAPQGEPVLGSFQTGGIIPQTGNFKMHAGEQVIPVGSQVIPKPPASTGGTGGQEGANAFDPIAPPFDITPPGGGGGGGSGGQVRPTESLGGAQGINPLQSAIQALLQLVQGGGPITSQLAQQQQARISDTFGQQLQNSQRSVQENFGARGLGGSGIEAALGLQQGLGLQENAARASNDLAVQQALQNFQGVQGAAQGLGGLSLGAGQFGLQQQAQQNQQQQSLMEFILQTIQGTFAPGAGAQTVNIV